MDFLDGSLEQRLGQGIIVMPGIAILEVEAEVLVDKDLALLI